MTSSDHDSTRESLEIGTQQKPSSTIASADNLQSSACRTAIFERDVLLAVGLLLVLAFGHVLIAYSWFQAGYTEPKLLLFFTMSALGLFQIILILRNATHISSISEWKTAKVVPIWEQPIDESNLSQLYAQFSSINGKFYLSKVYLIQILETANQIANIRTLYLCSLTPEFSAIFYVTISLETSFTIWTLYNIDSLSSSSRNFQVLIDISTDLFCLMVPLIILYSGYTLTPSVNETLLLTMMVSLCLIVRLKDAANKAIRCRRETGMDEVSTVPIRTTRWKAQGMAKLPTVLPSFISLHHLTYGPFSSAAFPKETPKILYGH